MKSPFTGGDAALCHEKQSFEFRKDNFEIVYHFYRCKDTNEEFTTTELDQLNMNQVYNLYRQKYAIPFPDEIKRQWVVRDCIASILWLTKITVLPSFLLTSSILPRHFF